MDTPFPNLGASSTSSSIPISLPITLSGTLFSTLAYITHFKFENLNLNDYNTLNLNDFKILNDTCELPPSSNSPNEN
jgi:hypothetical protein